MTRFAQLIKTHSVASFLCFLAIIGAAFAGVLSMGVSAARAAYTDCPSSTFCLWHATNYTSTQWNFTNSADGTDHWFVLGNAYQNSDSLVNNRSARVLIGDFNLRGDDCIQPGLNYRRADLSTWHFNDGVDEAFNITELDLIYSGTVCG